MLYLNPPFPLINGVSLFPDHENRNLFHYLPMAPRFTTVVDPQTRQRVPQFQLVRYKGRAGTGGVLNFDVNIGVDEDLLSDVARECRGLLGLRDTPVLSPVLVIDGTVSMMLLGAKSGDAAPLPDAPGPKFVIDIDHHAKPAMYGNHQAAFSVMLGQDGVSVLEKAMHGEMSPIGIVYSLEYLALRPAYNVSINVNWERVQKHFEEHTSVNALFVGTQIDKIVDELVEKRIIDIQVDTFVPEGDDEASIIGRRDQAVNEIREMITDAFFKPSLDPWTEERDGWDKAADFHGRMTRMGPMGPGSDPVFSYKKLDYTRIDRKSLNVRINERSTVKRTMYPQGHLSGLFRALTRDGFDLDRFIIDADLDNPFFAKRRVKVISRADHTTDSIVSVNATVQYGADKRNVILDQQKPDAELEWSSLLTGDVMQREVTTGYTVTFRNGDRLDRPVTMTSPPEVETGDVIEISPRKLYSILPIKVMVLKTTFPWDRISHVEVALAYKDEAHGIRSSETLMFDKDHRELTWPLFIIDPAKTQYQYKVIYHVEQGRNVELAWADADRDQISVANPFAAHHTVTIAVSPAVWTDADRVFVDVSYEDEDNGIVESQPFKFASGDADQTFSVDLADPLKRVVSFAVTFMLKDGRTIEVPESATRRSFITINRNMTGHRIVTVRPKAVDFAQKQVREMKVALEYTTGDDRWEDEFSFDSPLGPQYFEFNYSDPARTEYRHKETYVFTNGLTRETEWTETDAKELVLPVG